MDIMPSVMSHDFSKVPHADIPRSSFNRSHGYKTTFNAGYLVPIFVDEALPGDTFNLNMSGFGRLATPLHPIMDNLFMETFFFAVPIRLLWDNWQRFNGEQKDPGDSTDFLIPQVTTPVGGFVNGSVADYMGLPTEAQYENVNALHFRAYNLIYNEWFRDENLQDSANVPRDDGPDAYDANYPLRRRGKRHDYFTSCLPWPQKGDAVNLPIGTSAPIAHVPGLGQAGNMRFSSNDTRSLGTGAITLNAGSMEAAGVTAYYDPAGTLVADLSNAAAATVNQIREAFQIQKLYERDARGGTRYTEIIRSHFGVTSPDSRLQRPEYLGGGSTPIIINPVEQTSATDAAVSPQGNLAAYGTTHFTKHGFNKSFTEHCVLVGLLSVRADLNYQQGINRMWSRRDRWDYYWPALAHLGEQAVLSKEIFADGTAGDQDVFGYQERFAEYRYKPSLVTGQFRSNYSTPLDVWHLAQDFATRPVLGPNFIEENPPIERIISVQTEPHFIFDSYFSLQCARPMPMYSVPGMIDRF